MNSQHKPRKIRRILSRKNIARALGVVIALVILILGAWVAVAGPVTVYRIIRYGDTQIDDYKHYPSRRLEASQNPFLFTEDADVERVSIAIDADDLPNTSLDDLVASTDTIAFLIIMDDTLLYERYDQGHSQSEISQFFSVAKSITAILIGAAIEDGLLESVDQPVTDFIPELADQGFSDVTIRHLLTMMSGSDYDENDNPFGIHVILNYTPNLRDRILSFEVDDEPGEVWRYKSGDNALLALILERVLEPRTITDYTQEKLWTPLGMEYDGLWSLDHEGDGLEKTWCCLAATGRDLAKFGRFYLQEGTWEGQQIVSPEWITGSTTAAVPDGAWPDDYADIGLRNYGYQWWLASEGDGDFLALGKNGQYLYVNPAKNVVIVRLGWSSGDLTLGQWLSLFQYLADQVIE